MHQIRFRIPLTNAERLSHRHKLSYIIHSNLIQGKRKVE